jgi:hypothetical protein
MINFFQKRLLLLQWNPLAKYPKTSIFRIIKEKYKNFDILNLFSLNGISDNSITHEFDPGKSRFLKLQRISSLRERETIRKFYKLEKERIDKAVELNKTIFDDFDKEEEEILRKKLQKGK